MGGILIPDFDVTFGSFIREHGAPADSDQQASRRGPHPMTTTIEDVKRQAKRIARTTTVTHAQALDVLAVQTTGAVGYAPEMGREKNSSHPECGQAVARPGIE